MHEKHPRRRWHGFTLVVVGEALSALPDEFGFDPSTEMLVNRRYEERIPEPCMAASNA
jgi:hypothetical protein